MAKKKKPIQNKATDCEWNVFGWCQHFKTRGNACITICKNFRKELT